MLGAFLRSRRERLDPRLAGFAAERRRRTPGLRREEVAQLAGVSVTWYTWIEQGRAVSVTSAVLQSIARSLLLQTHERAYLFALARLPLPGGAPAAARVSPALQRLVDHQHPFPAYLMGPAWDVLAINSAASQLFGDFNAPPGETPNLLWYTFTSADARARIVDWETRAQRLIAEFRGDCSELLTEPWLAAFIARLCGASPTFAQWWARHDVYGRDGGRREFRQPGGGTLAYDQITLHPSGAGDHKLVIHIPLDSDDTRMTE
jgi:transcriptional regulator with XRE-family HTH domain